LRVCHATIETSMRPAPCFRGEVALPPSVRERSSFSQPPSQTSRRCEARISALKTAAEHRSFMRQRRGQAAERVANQSAGKRHVRQCKAISPACPAFFTGPCSAVLTIEFVGIGHGDRPLPEISPLLSLPRSVGSLTWCWWRCLWSTDFSTRRAACLCIYDVPRGWLSSRILATFAAHGRIGDHRAPCRLARRSRRVIVRVCSLNTSNASIVRSQHRARSPHATRTRQSSRAFWRPRVGPKKRDSPSGHRKVACDSRETPR